MSPTNKGRLCNGAKLDVLSSSQISLFTVLLHQGTLHQNITGKGRSAKLLACRVCHAQYSMADRLPTAFAGIQHVLTSAARGPLAEHV